jgi:hypothetical protein
MPRSLVNALGIWHGSQSISDLPQPITQAHLGPFYRRCSATGCIAWYACTVGRDKYQKRPGIYPPSIFDVLEVFSPHHVQARIRLQEDPRGNPLSETDRVDASVLIVQIR